MLSFSIYTDTSGTFPVTFGTTKACVFTFSNEGPSNSIAYLHTMLSFSMSKTVAMDVAELSTVVAHLTDDCMEQLVIMVGWIHGCYTLTRRRNILRWCGNCRFRYSRCCSDIVGVADASTMLTLVALYFLATAHVLNFHKTLHCSLLVAWICTYNHLVLLLYGRPRCTSTM